MIINVDQLSEAISQTLDSYNRKIIDTTKNEAAKAMDRLVKETKATAPVGRRRKHYKNSITSRKEWESPVGVEHVWYVKGPDYRLSHLLENGHATKSGGRVEGLHFIKNAADPIIEDYQKAIEEACKGD